MNRLAEKYILVSLVSLFAMVSCKQKDSADPDESIIETRTPVTVTSISYDSLQEFIELNATASFL